MIPLSAWRDQLLEALGATGMGEVCRLRGELGLAIFEEDEEQVLRALCSGTSVT